jgi:hypothetical protein
MWSSRELATRALMNTATTIMAATNGANVNIILISFAGVDGMRLEQPGFRRATLLQM